MQQRSDAIVKIGLRNHLEQTKSEHDDHGYDDFVRYVTLGVSKKALSLIFRVRRDTIYKWLEVYETEKSNAQQTSA